MEDIIVKLTEEIWPHLIVKNKKNTFREENIMSLDLDTESLGYEKVMSKDLNYLLMYNSILDL